MRTFAAPLLTAALVAGTVSLPNAASAAGDRPMAIPFAALGNIRNWKPDGQNAMYVESQRGDWYHATFWSPCFELPFADRIGFVTEPGGSLDKFSSIMVGGDRCWFRSFEKSGAPSGAR